MQKSISALEYIINLQKTLFNPSNNTLNRGNELLSKMYYRYECSDSSQSTRIVSQEIEPLIGLLRDPLTICPHQYISPALRMDGGDPIQSKRFFLLGPSAPYYNFSSLATPIVPWLYKEGSQKILFDLGSSYFNGFDEQAASSAVIGTRWFYEYFRLNSLSFDRIIAFEATEYKPQAYWNQIPNDVMGLLTFINRGVETTGKFNPWNILKSIAKVDDYVIIKLDIDTPTLENELINQVLNDISISSLIDEMFFEMHVTVNEMLPFWGRAGGELKDSYVLFRKLREAGIRMHSWP